MVNNLNCNATTPMQAKPGQFAEVVVNIPINKRFHYGIPDNIAGKISVGKLLKVPFGKRFITGYCVGLTNTSDVSNVKDIIAVMDDTPSIDEGMLRITKWISEYYCCSWGEALEAALPGAVKKGSAEKYSKFISLAKNRDETEKEIKRIDKRSPAQARILRSLIDTGTAVDINDLLRTSTASRSSIVRLEERGLITSRSAPTVRDDADKPPEDPSSHAVPRPDLTEEQRDATSTIESSLKSERFNVILLHGVTGSGKTEVYLRSIEMALSQKRSCIVLVPEISLTPQTIRYFKTRFSNIAIMHSNLQEGDRKKQWRRIKDNHVNVVVGTRSAIFAPISDLGLVIVDEEHESTFKQDNSPRYHGRDVSIMRAMFNNATIVLGSATPSLESYRNAMTGKYLYVPMKKKIDKMVPPSVVIVNMKDEFLRTRGHQHLSRYLEGCMRKTLSNKEQVILFLNRRGFAQYINCKRCGFILKCMRCDISLTYHKGSNNMICHYCSREQIPPKDCPECAMPNIKYQGYGTERVEDEIKRKFPDQRLLRMDSDTMKQKCSHETAFSDFLDGTVNILLGTQMIAKGLDFPNVTLVGIISADSSLNIPDFRSSERTFQLIAQVSGRTGRGSKGGSVVIQSFNTDHYSIRHASKPDYKGFADEELSFRKELNYPPFGRIIRIVFLDKNESRVKETAGALTKMLKTYSRNNQLPVDILGPVVASISKIRDKFRWHTILKSTNSGDAHKVAAQINNGHVNAKGTQIIVDVDPFNML